MNIFFRIPLLAGITIGSSQIPLSSQNTNPVVRATPTVVASNPMITVTEIRPTLSSTNLLIQTTAKTQSNVPFKNKIYVFLV